MHIPIWWIEEVPQEPSRAGVNSRACPVGAGQTDRRGFGEVHAMETAGGRSRTAFWAVAEWVAEVAWHPKCRSIRPIGGCTSPARAQHREEPTMAFKQREKRRKRRAATAAAQSKSRETGSAQRKWWLTIATRHASCNRCAGKLREGREIVYRHVPQEVLCKSCAESDALVSYRPSLRWVRTKHPEVGTKTATA